MRKRRVMLGLAAGIILLASLLILLYSCSRGGSGAARGTVALYATDDLSDYKQVIATITLVQLRNTGTAASCDLLTEPATVDIANLADTLQLLSVVDCPAVPYNRIHVEFGKSVDLMDPAGNTSVCSFTSYKDNANQPNTLQCSDGTCSLDINGAVNVLAGRSDKLALDFKLKNFEVEHAGTASCSVTMKVSPVGGEDVAHLGHPEGITGIVSDVTTSTQAFTLTKGRRTYTVLYSAVTPPQQPGLGDLLLRAEQDMLRTRVSASSLDFTSDMIDAASILVKVEGTVSALDTANHTFALTYKGGKTMIVDYGGAAVEGALADNAGVEAKLYGYDGGTGDFLAAKVEVEFESSVPDEQRVELNTED